MSLPEARGTLSLLSYTVLKMRDEWTFSNDRRRRMPQTEKGSKSHAELSQIDFRWIQSKPGGPSISWSRPTEEAWVTIISRHTQLLTNLNDEVTILLFTSPCLMKPTGRGGTWTLKQYFGGKCCWHLGFDGCSTIGSSRKHSDNNRNLQRFFS